MIFKINQNLKVVTVIRWQIEHQTHIICNLRITWWIPPDPADRVFWISWIKLELWTRKITIVNKLIQIKDKGWSSCKGQVSIKQATQRWINNYFLRVKKINFAIGDLLHRTKIWNEWQFYNRLARKKRWRDKVGRVEE